MGRRGLSHAIVLVAAVGLSAGTPALAAVPWCDKPAEAFAGSPGSRPYRPLPTFERESRIGRNGPFQPARLAIDLTMRQATVRIGEHLVDKVPISRLTPDAMAGAYLFGENGRQCRIRPSDLRSATFVEAWGYAGARLQLEQRDTLAVDVRSQLELPQAAATESNAPIWRPDVAPFGGAPCQTTSLHTHGLLVSPYKRLSLLGDYVLDLARPSADMSDRCDDGTMPVDAHAHGDVRPVLRHRISIPAKPTQPGQADALESGKHPSGLFWFHPHPHGYSASQLSGGTTGLITIGSIGDYAAHLPAQSPQQQNMRFLMLKDAQIEPKPGGGRVFRATSDTALCAKAPPGKGFWPDGECIGDGDARWVFTVNGVEKPRIAADVRPGEAELWRIANASPTVSYHLSLVPLDEVTAMTGPDGPLTRTNFFVLAKDGTGLPDSGSQAAEEKELLLMPGARVEILIPPLEARTYALVTEGLETGGDTWPRVVLATIQGKGGGVSATPPEPPPVQRGTPPAPTTSGPDINRTIAGSRPASVAPAPSLDTLNPCGKLAGRERLILFVKNPQFSDTDPAWGRGDLLGLIAGVRDAGQRDPDQARYFVRPTASTPFDQMERHTLSDLRPSANKAYSATAPNFIPAFGNFPALADVCALYDPDPAVFEEWVLENWTNEIHNFHIHQTRFTIAPRSTADENYFAFPCGRSAYTTMPTDPNYGADKPCWLDGTSDGDPQVGFGDELIAQFYRGHLSTGLNSSVEHDAAHDSVPLPRGTAACDGHVWTGQETDQATKAGQPVCQPARVTVRLRFNRREQVGRFVYHCHILEHEDRGMMALVEVRGPDYQAGQVAESRTRSHH